MFILYKENIDKKLVEVEEYKLPIYSAISKFYSKYKSHIYMTQYNLENTFRSAGFISVVTETDEFYLINISEEVLDNPPNSIYRNLMFDRIEIRKKITNRHKQIDSIL